MRTHSHQTNNTQADVILLVTIGDVAVHGQDPAEPPSPRSPCWNIYNTLSHFPPRGSSI